MAAQPPSQNVPKIPEPLIKQFLDLQEKEIQLRLGQVEIQKQQDNNNFAYANKVVESQVQDRQSQRVHEQDFYSKLFSAIKFVVCLLIILIGMAFYLNKDAMAIELIKLIAYPIIGAFGGYGFAQNKPTKTTVSKQE